jgi:2-polyprenyl-3-methyl-5-hydroxy-6-metoxy-1,4-benzoquinol methylase
MEIEENNLCPICGSSAKTIKQMDATFIESKLASHFNTRISDDLNIPDYELMQCPACAFEFASPKLEGSSAFYNWITSQPNYYVETRWEYPKVLELLSRKTKKINLLDVGCGDGLFFDFITNNEKGNPEIDLYGLDPTPGSIEKCKKKGYKAFCMDVQEFKSTNKDTLFDVITCYHVLEHISNPKQFLQELKGLMKPGGEIYISTPYSPMDFELEWYDVLNHPPHHMGRWNLNSYQKIAEILELQIEIFMPKAKTLLKVTAVSFMFSIYGPPKNQSKIKTLKVILRYPFRFLRHLKTQSKRARISGIRAGNVILVKLTKQ